MRYGLKLRFPFRNTICNLHTIKEVLTWPSIDNYNIVPFLFSVLYFGKKGSDFLIRERSNIHGISRDDSNSSLFQKFNNWIQFPTVFPRWINLDINQSILLLFSELSSAIQHRNLKFPSATLYILLMAKS